MTAVSATLPSSLSSSVNTHYYLEVDNLQENGKEIGGIKMGVVTSAPNEGSNTALVVGFDVFRLADCQNGVGEVAKSYFMPCLVKTSSGALANGVHVVTTGATDSEYLSGAEQAVKTYLGSYSVEPSRVRLRAHYDETLTKGVLHALDNYTAEQRIGRVFPSSTREGSQLMSHIDRYAMGDLNSFCKVNPLDESFAGWRDAHAPASSPSGTDVDWTDTVCFRRPYKSILGHPSSNTEKTEGPFPLLPIMYRADGTNGGWDRINAIPIIETDNDTSGSEKVDQERKLARAMQGNYGVGDKLSEYNGSGRVPMLGESGLSKLSKTFFDPSVSLASHIEAANGTDEVLLKSILQDLGPQLRCHRGYCQQSPYKRYCLQSRCILGWPARESSLCDSEPFRGFDRRAYSGPGVGKSS